MSNKHQIKRSKRSNRKWKAYQDRTKQKDVPLADLLAAKRAANRQHRN